MAAVDLHLHTTASDGRLSPTNLVRLLNQRGIKVAAITDHDSTEAIDEAFEAGEEFPELTLIAGIELSTEIPDTEVHILGYFIKREDKALQSILKGFRLSRVARASGMVEKLAKMGLKIEWDQVMKFAVDGSVGRPHIALAMIEKGYVKDTKEAFDRYLGHNGPAHVERSKLSPADAINLIKSVDGAAVLAHPTWVDNLEGLLPQLKKSGLAGMEVYYGSYSPYKVRYLAKLAERFDLIPCGGSDYHAMGNPDETLPGHQGPPIGTVKRLRDSISISKVSGGSTAPPAVP